MYYGYLRWEKQRTIWLEASPEDHMVIGKVPAVFWLVGPGILVTLKILVKQ